MNKLISVIGTVFMDIKGFAHQDYVPSGRNLGGIQFIHGGVGRNIAENIARMNHPIALVASVDDAGTGLEIIERLDNVGVDTQYIQKAQHQGMGMWLAILNEHGELAGSISQMPDLTTLQQLVFSQGTDIISRSSHIALEIDLNEELSEKVMELAQSAGKPVFGIPGNMDIILRRPDLLHGMACFICNDIEASRLMERQIQELSREEQLERLRDYVGQAGLEAMVVTLGDQGSIYYDTVSGEAGYQEVFPVQMVDSTGAGDAFFSGTVTGLVRGLPLKDAVICGTKVAGWTIESAESNCPNLQERLARDPLLLSLLAESK